MRRRRRLLWTLAAKLASTTTIDTKSLLLLSSFSSPRSLNVYFAYFTSTWHLLFLAQLVPASSAAAAVAPALPTKCSLIGAKERRQS